MGKREFLQGLKNSANYSLQKANKLLSELGLTIHINWEYNDWKHYAGAIGLYERDSVLEGDISIAFNINNLYTCFNNEVKQNPWSDPYEMLDECVQTNVFHEMGHGIVQFLEDIIEYADENEPLPFYDNNQRLCDKTLDEEEDSVEEFAWAMYDNTPQKSQLYKITELYIMHLKQQNDITESLLDKIIKESLNKVLRENKSNIETWYRGYNSAYGSEKSHLLWVTDDISYARSYGNRVEEITIDMNKLNVISLYGMDELFGYEIDYLDGPTEDEARELIDNGYDAYEFEANQGMSICLCMWDKSSITNRRELSRQEFEQIETYDGFDNQPWGN